MSRAGTAIVVGAGIGGLTAAMKLAHLGWRVEVHEKALEPGGRCGRVRLEDFTFDLGPTILLMPFIFEQTFASVGRKLSDYVELRRCDPNYRVTFADDSTFTLTSELTAMRTELERLEPGCFERYLAFDDVDPLVQAAVVHAQFELLHPFNDGNGRIGRLLIPLFLFQKRALASPMFYLSEYLEAHRDRYYAGLRGISQQSDWTGWVEFFLIAITEQSQTNTVRVRSILELYERMKQQISDLTRSQYALKVLDALFDRPIFESSDFVERSGIPKNTALPFLRKLREAGILRLLREKSGRRSAVLAFSELLNCAEGRKIL